MSEENRDPSVGAVGPPSAQAVSWSSSLNRPLPALLLSGLWTVLFLWSGAATIVRADRPAAAPATSRSARRSRASPRQRSEPDDDDFKLRDLVAFMARGLVDHPDDVAVEILEAGDDAGFELQRAPRRSRPRDRQAGTHRALAAPGARRGRRARAAAAPSLEIAD